MSKKIKPPDLSVDLLKYKKRVLKRLAANKAMQPADVLAMALPDLMSLAAELLEHIAETEDGLDRHSDGAGLVINKA